MTRLPDGPALIDKILGLPQLHNNCRSVTKALVRGGGWIVLLVFYLAGECCGLTMKELREAARRFQQQMERNADLAARFAQAVSTLWNVDGLLPKSNRWVGGPGLQRKIMGLSCRPPR